MAATSKTGLTSTGNTGFSKLVIRIKDITVPEAYDQIREMKVFSGVKKSL